MLDENELRQKMSVIRTRGLVNASALGERVEKLSDWREHVRAHPWPAALAVGALAYWIVPRKASQIPEHSNGFSLKGRAAASVNTEGLDREVKSTGLAGLSGAAMGFLGSLLGNAVRSYVSEQVQTLITSRGNHATKQQRQTPYSGF